MVMNRSASSLTLVQVLALAVGAAGLLLISGCAAATPGEGDVAASDALMSDASLVGKYYGKRVPSGGIARLTLSADGSFSAMTDAGDSAECIAAPCLLQASGTWTVTKGEGQQTLSLAAPGEAARAFAVTKYEGDLTITGADGKAQTLTMLDADQCLNDSDCSSAQRCAPRVCAMLCASDSPFCCGVSTCQTPTAR
jgi:hypothetical protein